MAKKLSQKVISGVEALLVSLMAEASKGDHTVQDNEGKDVVIPGPSFSERLKIVTVATGFLQAQAKIGPDEPEKPSAFQEDILDELGTKSRSNGNRPKKTPGAKKLVGGEISDIGPADNERAIVIDYLASDPGAKYIRVGSGPSFQDDAADDDVGIAAE